MIARIGSMFCLCACCLRMIQPDNEELARAIGIALITTKSYSLRNVFSPTQAIDRCAAVKTLTARVKSSLGRQEFQREASLAECCDRKMPLFPEFARNEQAGQVGNIQAV